MRGQSSVAGFASHDHVFAQLFLIHHVAMADLAGIVAGKGNRPGCCLADGSAAIVPVLAKTSRDDRGTEEDECNQRYRHDGRKPHEVFYVFEQVLVPTSDLARYAHKIAHGALISGIALSGR